MKYTAQIKKGKPFIGVDRYHVLIKDPDGLVLDGYLDISYLALLKVLADWEGASVTPDSDPPPAQ